MPRARGRRKPSTTRRAQWHYSRRKRVRFAKSLDDYEHVPPSTSVAVATDGHWLVVRDHRFGLDYEIDSHADYWDFIGALVDHRQYVARRSGGRWRDGGASATGATSRCLRCRRMRATSTRSTTTSTRSVATNETRRTATRETLLTGIAEGTIDRIPEIVREVVLDRIRRLGFSRRCPCLYDEAYGFGGYDVTTFGADDSDNDGRTACELCGGSGNYDPLPQLLELTDDKAAAAWVAEELPKSAGPCDLWTAFPEEGWHYEALGYHRKGKGAVRGVTLYNLDQMAGGVITWLDIADVFRPRPVESFLTKVRPVVLSGGVETDPLGH